MLIRTLKLLLGAPSRTWSGALALVGAPGTVFCHCDSDSVLLGNTHFCCDRFPLGLTLPVQARRSFCLRSLFPEIQALRGNRWRSAPWTSPNVRRAVASGYSTLSSFFAKKAPALSFFPVHYDLRIAKISYNSGNWTAPPRP